MHRRPDQAPPSPHLHPRLRDRADAHARRPQAFRRSPLGEAGRAGRRSPKEGRNTMSEILMPPPPAPATSAGQKQVVFEEVVLWLLANYGLLAVGELRGAGRVAPLRTRTATAP